MFEQTEWYLFVLFQSRTGFPGHLDYSVMVIHVWVHLSFNPERASQAI